MNSLSQFPTQLRSSTWFELSAEIEVIAQMRAGANSTGPFDIDQVEIRLLIDAQVVVLIPESTENHPKKIATLIANGDWTAESPTALQLRSPANTVLRRVQRNGAPDYWDLAVGRAHQDTTSLTDAMVDAVGEDETERIFEILRPLARPCPWPAWIQNDENGEFSLAPELPADLDPIVWRTLRTQVIEAYSLEQDQVRFDLPLFDLGDSLHAL